MMIKLIDGLHLTAADKRDLTAIIRNGWTRGATKQKRYSIRPAPMIGGNHWTYKLTKRETDMNGRPGERISRGLILVK